MKQKREKGQLTKRQRQILGFIKRNSRMCGPTVREIGEAMGISSLNGVVFHIRALERKGHIRKTQRVSRGIEVLT